MARRPRMRSEAERVHGNFADRNVKATYFVGDKLLAAATIFRDKESLEIEAAMEKHV